MARPDSEKNNPMRKDPEPQPPVLREFLRALNTARRQSSLYGSDHPNMERFITEASQALDNYLDCFGASTFIFAEEAVIVNDNWYDPSNDSRDLCQRLRGRGTLAFTVVDKVPTHHVIEFLAFLNMEPKEIRAHGGPSAYLRKKSVSRIVATEAIYAAGDDADGDSSQTEEQPATMDRALAAAIKWLTDHDDDAPMPRVKTSELFSDSEMAAKLVREAVTKLHSSRRSRPKGEGTDDTTSVVQDLKSLSAQDQTGWDHALPQVRKAIAKLPPEMRPNITGFSAPSEGDGPSSSDGRQKSVDVPRVETLIVKAIYAGDDPDPDLNLKVSQIDELFDAVPTGLLSSWTGELQPPCVLKRQGETLAALMAWETNSAEHGHMARSLALLIATAFEIGEVETALEFASCLASELRAPGQLPWRATNARYAFQILDDETLTKLVDEAVRHGTPRVMESAVILVDEVPAIAISALHTLQGCRDTTFTDALKRGIAKSSRSAAPALGKLISEGSEWERDTAIDILVSLRTDWATDEIGRAVQRGDDVFAARTIALLPTIGSSMAAQICLDNLKHDSSDVRCAALRALGDIGDESALPDLIRAATAHGWRMRNTLEQVAAIEALGALGSSDAVPCLERLARRVGFFWPTRTRMVREAAQRSLGRIAVIGTATAAEAA